MAYDKDNQRLYTYTDAQTGEKVGITTLEIYKCLRYNKRDKNGNRQAALAIKYGNINDGARNKPVRSDSEAPIGDTERKAVNWGLVAKDNEQIKTSFMNIDSEFGNSFTDFTLVPWEYERPRGVTSEHTEWFRELDFDGYKHLVSPPLSLKSSSATVNMNDGALDIINADVNGNSMLQFGNVGNIDILLGELNWAYVWPSLSVVSSSILDGSWRLAVAIRIPRTDGYKWLIASSVKPLEVYDNPQLEENFKAHRIMLNAGNFGARLKNLARYAETDTLLAVPFLAHGLNYTEQRGWTWSGDANDKAITFPRTDNFDLKLTGFASTIKVEPVSTILKINGTQATAVSGSGGVGLRIARSIAAAATSAEVTFKFRVTSCFGVNTELKGVSNISANTPSSLSGKGASGTSTFNSEGLEWDGVNEEYTMTYNDAGLVAILKATASQSSLGNIGSEYNVGIQFKNSVLAKQLNFHNLVSFITIAFS